MSQWWLGGGGGWHISREFGSWGVGAGALALGWVWQGGGGACEAHEGVDTGAVQGGGGAAIGTPPDQFCALPKNDAHNSSQTPAWVPGVVRCEGS